MVDWIVLEFIKNFKTVVLTYVLLIVSGLHGVYGPHVLRHVGMDYKKERGLKPQMPKMVERNALEVIKTQSHVMKKIVQVYNTLCINMIFQS